MKYFKLVTVSFIMLTLVACNKGNVKQADPNYMQQINSYNQAQMAKAQMVESLSAGCQKDQEDAAWCTALITQTIMGSGSVDKNSTPKYTPKPTKGDILLSKSLDIVGKALPIFGNVVISKDNNETNARIAESRNQMMTDIVTSGFNGLTTLGSQENIAVGGDYIIGDGNGDGDRYGDGNIVGDGNVSTGDGSLVGDSNILGDDNVTGDGNLFANGDGNVIGDENTNTTGDDNIVGDSNTSTDGNENAVDNDVEGDLFTGGDSNGDEETPEDPEDGGGT